ncbi:MAG: hypothetical protein ACO35C_04465 [Pontimonas sp.]
MMLVVVSMMVMSSCVMSSMSSGVFVAANENWLTGAAFDWMDWGGWADFKSWFGFKPAASPDPAAGTNPSPSDTTTGTVTSPTSKYKENCVYLYTGKDAKSGYLRTICVDKKDPNKLGSWKWSADKSVQSLRVGKEVKASVIPEKAYGQTLTINGSDATKPINLTDKDFADRAGAISVSYKQYSTSGDLKSVGGSMDETCVYLYNDNNGNGYLDTACSKSSEIVLYQKSIVNRVSSLRVGKRVSVVLYSDGSINPLRVDGAGTSTLVDLTKTTIPYSDKIKKMVLVRK